MIKKSDEQKQKRSEDEQLPRSEQKLLIKMLRHLVLTREFELKCQAMWKAGEHMVGEYHLSLGQEAIAVGTCDALLPNDLICPSIRGMGVYLSRGTSLVKLMSAIFDRSGAICHGRWAHWHSPVPEAGILAQTGMLGSGLVTSVGVALAQKHCKTGKVVVAMLGDGATNTGYFHEGMNFAAFRDLPIIVVIENNQYAVSTPIRSVTKAANLSDRAIGYGIPGQTVNGNDVITVNQAVHEAVQRARGGGGASLIECISYRWSGSTVKDPDLLRPTAEKEAALRNCPIEHLKKHLVKKQWINEQEFVQLVRDARSQIDQAEIEAKHRKLLNPAQDLLKAYSAYAQ